MSEFLDTNILFYAYDSDSGQKQELSIELMSRLIPERIGVVSIQVLVEFYNAATRKFRMTSEEAETVLGGLAEWRLHRPDHASVISAIHVQRRYKLAWYDAMILNSALESGCSILWTEDFSDGQRFGDLVVKNPYKNARVV